MPDLKARVRLRRLLRGQKALQGEEDEFASGYDDTEPPALLTPSACSSVCSHDHGTMDDEDDEDEGSDGFGSVDDGTDQAIDILQDEIRYLRNALDTLEVDRLKRVEEISALQSQVTLLSAEASLAKETRSTDVKTASEMVNAVKELKIQISNLRVAHANLRNEQIAERDSDISKNTQQYESLVAEVRRMKARQDLGIRDEIKKAVRQAMETMGAEQAISTEKAVESVKVQGRKNKRPAKEMIVAELKATKSEAKTAEISKRDAALLTVKDAMLTESTKGEDDKSDLRVQKEMDDAKSGLMKALEKYKVELAECLKVGQSSAEGNLNAIRQAINDGLLRIAVGQDEFDNLIGNRQASIDASSSGILDLATALKTAQNQAEGTLLALQCAADEAKANASEISQATEIGSAIADTATASINALQNERAGSHAAILESRVAAVDAIALHAANAILASRAIDDHTTVHPLVDVSAISRLVVEGLAPVKLQILGIHRHLRVLEEQSRENQSRSIQMSPPFKWGPYPGNEVKNMEAYLEKLRRRAAAKQKESAASGIEPNGSISTFPRGRSKAVRVTGANLTPLRPFPPPTVPTESTAPSPPSPMSADRQIDSNESKTGSCNLRSVNESCESDCESCASYVKGDLQDDVKPSGMTEEWPMYWEGGDPTGLGRWTKRAGDVE